MRRRAFSAAAALFAAFGVLPACRRSNPVDPLSMRQRATAIGAQHGLLIGYGAPQGFFVPPYTTQDARIPNGEATQIELDALPRAFEALENALRVYPPGFYVALCKAIFLCGSLTLDGAVAGGTYGRAWIILVAARASGGDGIFETVRLGVHHEFSSLVWNRVPALRSLWMSLLPTGWAPVRDNAQALKSSDRGLARIGEGFLSPYGATTAENDFNVYAERVFADAGAIAALAREHALVARKLGLLMGAYSELDARMPGVFEKAGLGWIAREPITDPGATVSPLTIPGGKISR